MWRSRWIWKLYSRVELVRRIAPPAHVIFVGKTWIWMDRCWREDRPVDHVEDRLSRGCNMLSNLIGDYPKVSWLLIFPKVFQSCRSWTNLPWIGRYRLTTHQDCRKSLDNLDHSSSRWILNHDLGLGILGWFLRSTSQKRNPSLDPKEVWHVRSNRGLHFSGSLWVSDLSSFCLSKLPLRSVSSASLMHSVIFESIRSSLEKILPEWSSSGLGFSGPARIFFLQR